MAQSLKDGGSRVSGSASNALPGRKLATSKRPRMLKPFEIDLLRQDLQTALKLLGQDEIDDAHGVMRDCGFRSSDFEIVQHADPSPPYPSEITGSVTVIRRTNQLSKTYTAGSGSRWLQQLEFDLKSGSFGATS